MTQKEKGPEEIRQYPIVKVLELGQVFASDLGIRTERYVLELLTQKLKI